MTAAFNVPSRVPGRVSQPLRTPTWKVQTLMKVLARGGDASPEPAQVDEFIKFLWLGDPLADSVIAENATMPAGQGRQLFEQALEKGIDSLSHPPESLVNLFAPLDSVPIWVDRQQLNQGCEVIRRTGWFAELVLRNVSLMGGYLSSAANKPLAFTGQLDKLAPKRLIETGKFWVDVTTPDGLLRQNEGFKSAIRVRMMHATVRHMLNASGRWNQQQWGHPINQADTMATNLLFSFIFMAALRGLGFQFTTPERQAVMHLWRYIGYLLGIDERILPTNEADGARFAYLHYTTFAHHDEDTRALGEALSQVPFAHIGDNPARKWLARAESGYRSAMSRLVLGGENADALGLPDSAWKYAVMGTVPAIFTMETFRRLLPGGTWAATRLGRLIHEELLQSAIVQTRADTGFNAVKSLAR